jgi:hypothetical protein
MYFLTATKSLSPLPRPWDYSLALALRKHISSGRKQLSGLIPDMPSFLLYWGLNSGPSPGAILSALFLWGVFRDRFLLTICWGWLRTAILLISASWVARIIGRSHWSPAWYAFSELHSRDWVPLPKHFSLGVITWAEWSADTSRCMV